VLVFERDGGCVAARVDRSHECAGRLTIEHVPELGLNALGKRAPSDPRHLLTLCLGANSGEWAPTHREDERAWLAQFYPESAA
jgi:hypothetical protein